jgi:hypothetical protein
MVAVLILSANPAGARTGSLMAGLFLAVPCFMPATPLSRGLLMCCMAAPFLGAGALVLAPPITSFRARLGYLLSWSDARQVKRRAHALDLALLVQLVTATAVLAAAISVAKTSSGSGLGMVVRWFAGGIIILAFGEMATAALPLVATGFGLSLPPLMHSPYRSTSIGEFWSKRWNVYASQRIIGPFLFLPLWRRGVALALLTSFALSGLGHALLTYMALGRWNISIMAGVYFIVQPLIILGERRLEARRWRPVAAHLWTLGILGLTSPLFVEPALQIVEKSWGTTNEVLLPTTAVLGFALGFSCVVSLACLASLQVPSVDSAR